MLYLVENSSHLLYLCRMFARRRKPTYWDYSVNCTGNEAHLSSCKLGQAVLEKSNGTCPRGLPVVVSCVPGKDFAPTLMMGFRKAFRQEVKNPTLCQYNKWCNDKWVLHEWCEQTEMVNKADIGNSCLSSARFTGSDIEGECMKCFGSMLSKDGSMSLGELQLELLWKCLCQN